MDTNTYLSEETAELRLLRPGTGPLSTLQDYWELVKPEITFQVVLAALAGFILGTSDGVTPLLMTLTLTGTAFSSAGAGVLNHYVERHNDALMRRTAQRPLPSGRINPRVALGLGLVLVASGLTLLWWVNLITLILAGITVFLYLFAYTPLKQRTTYNTLIGTIPGALPALGGYTAASGTFGTGGWILFGMLALWQLPHFLALAWMYRKDYSRGGHAMLPAINSNAKATAHRILTYSILLPIASLLLFFFDLAGWIYVSIVIPAGIGLIWPSIKFTQKQTSPRARKVLMASIIYVPILVVAILLDHWFR